MRTSLVLLKSMDEDFSGLDRMFMTSDELDRSTVTYSTVANVPESYERAT